jgi:hypothetical protein
MSLTKEQGIQLLELELALLRGDISRDELNSKASALNLPVPDYLREAERPIGLPQPITITAEQLIKRSKWEQALLRGEITLVDALDVCMAIGVPATEYMRGLFAKAVADYQDGKELDFAKSLGISMTKCERNAAINECVTIPHRRYVAKDLVDAIAAETGLPKTDPSQYSKTVFHAASETATARLHRMTPSQLKDLYFEKKTQKKTKKK